jgi:hypothetical protein
MYLISVFSCCSVFSYLWKEKFHEGKAVYEKHVGIFLMFFLLHTKLIFPCMQGDLNKSNAGIYLLDTNENSHFRPNLPEDLQQCTYP